VPALARTHAEAGIEPNGWTTTPDWHGESLDYTLAIEMLRRPTGFSPKPTLTKLRQE
jgi:hypothetical protein